MAARYNFLNTGSLGRTIRDEDFEEEDVWSVAVDINKSTAKVRIPKQDKFSVSSTPAVRRLPTASRMIPRANTSAESQEVKVMQQSSAPVNIPDWSKIYRKNPRKEADDSYTGGFGGASVRYGGGFGGIIGDDDDDDDDDDIIPPHEWIAKKLAMSQISSFSVCEGVGRTLKGRDLSKVRDAVLTRTGFIE